MQPQMMYQNSTNYGVQQNMNAAQQKVVSPYKYPNQVVCCKRNEMNFYAEAILRTPTDQELRQGDYPGMDTFARSRFDLYIFKYEDKKSVKYCLSPKAISLLYLKTQSVIEHQMLNKKITAGLTPAYTTVLKGRDMNGKTAAQFLIEHPEKVNDLIAQRNYYAANMADARYIKYVKKNQEAVQAIDEAVSLYQQGKLDAAKIMDGGEELYNGVKTPNVQKVDNNGLTEVRQIIVSYNQNNSQAPFTVTIMNCMAPPIQGNGVGAKLEQATSKNKWSINLTEEEWYSFITELQALCEDFRHLTAKRRFQIYGTNPYNY